LNERPAPKPFATSKSPARLATLLLSVMLCGLPLEARAEQAVALDDSGVSDFAVIGGISDRGEARLSQARVGDLNGDGFADLLLGAPGADANGRSSAGAIYVLFGRTDRIAQAKTDLTFISEYDLRIEGSFDGQQLGFQLAVDDLNGDGLVDAVFSSPGGLGAVFVKYGGDSWPRGVLSIDDQQSWDFRVVGEVNGSLLGSTLCLGDLNADGRAELAFSVLGLDNEGRLNSTDVHLLGGRAAWPQRSYTLNERIPRRVTMVRRLGSAVRVVHTCALGDLDGNGAGDIALGMPLDWANEREEAGSVSVIYDVLGHTGSAVDLADPEAIWGLRILGNQAGARLGSALAIADFNGDHGADLAVGAPRRLLQGPASEGAVYLFWGQSLGEGILDQNPNLSLPGSGGEFGSVIDLGDFNADSRLDLLIGAPKEDNYAGQGAGSSYVYLSGPSMSSNDNPPYDHRLAGSSQVSGLGYSAAIGDLDGDGKSDWALRASGHPLGRSASGSILVIPACTELGKELSQDSISPWTILGPGRGGGIWSRMRSARLTDDKQDSIFWLSPEGGGDRGLLCLMDPAQSQALPITDPDACRWLLRGPTGTRLSAVDVGDFDADGELELALGLNDAKHDDGLGAVWIMELPSSFEGSQDLSMSKDELAQSWLLLADETSQGLGTELLFADVDADGADDLIVSAPLSGEDDRENGGAVLIFRGGKQRSKGRAEAKSADWRFEGSEGSRAGSQISVIDLDGNGELELWVVAPGERVPGRERAGIGFLLFGLSRLTPHSYDLSDPDISLLRILGSTSDGDLHSADPWDVNADGYEDLLLWEPQARPSSRAYGRGYVLYGGPERSKGSLDLADPRQVDLSITVGRGEQLNGLVAGDINGDYATDLVTVVDSTLSTGLSTVRAATLRHEIGELQLTASIAEWQFRTPSGGSFLTLPSALPDTQHNGQNELWILEPFANRRTVDQGAVWKVRIDSSTIASPEQQ
jgi:hypothetical protein